MSSYTIDINATEIQTVGELNIDLIKRLVGLELPEKFVKAHPGVWKHIKRNHPGIVERYGHLIPTMISNPDYIGRNPTEPNSIELIKVVNDHLLLAIKTDPSGYVFLSSFYDMKNGENKVRKRLVSGRLIPYSSNV